MTTRQGMRLCSPADPAPTGVPERIYGSPKDEFGVDQIAGQPQLDAAAKRHGVGAGNQGLVDVAQFLDPDAGVAYVWRNGVMK